MATPCLKYRRLRWVGDSCETPGHCPWRYGDRYGQRLADYCAGMSEYAPAYEDIRQAVGKTRVRVENEVDASFEFPEEFGNRIGLLGMILMKLGSLSRIAIALTMVSGLMVIVTKSDAVDLTVDADVGALGAPGDDGVYGGGIGGLGDVQGADRDGIRDWSG